MQSLQHMLRFAHFKRTVLHICCRSGSTLHHDATREDESNVFGSIADGECSKYSEKRHWSKNIAAVKEIRIKQPKPPDNSDVFGNLTEKEPLWYPNINEDLKPDNDQSDDSHIVRNFGLYGKCPRFYLRRMKELVNEKKLKQALELFVEMRRNFVHPEIYHFTFMIGACGRIGFTEMAFKLLRQMTDRGMKPTEATIVGLFNSCAESPDPSLGLANARLLREKIQLKGWPLNQTAYNAMIKAFGKCGDITTAFQIADEMVKEEFQIDVATYNNLLVSCISDRESGFTHAVEVWRKMLARKCRPRATTFNLLLRAVRNCGTGPPEIACLLLQHWTSFPARPYGMPTRAADSPERRPPLLQIEGEAIVKISDSTTEHVEESKSVRTAPPQSVCESREVNILGVRPTGLEVMELENLNVPHQRLSLLGGLEGVLASMKKMKARPNVKTFTMLLEVMPPSSEPEDRLLELMEEHGVSPTIGFCNVLIKRRHCRLDKRGARDVLQLLNKHSLSPDIITFGCLAIGCRRHTDAMALIRDLGKLGFSANQEIVGTLIKNAGKARDFKYLQYVMELILAQEMPVTKRMLSSLEGIIANIRKNVLDMEHGKAVADVFQSEGFSENFCEFVRLYEEWLKKVNFQKEVPIFEQYNTSIVVKATEDVL